MKKTIVALAFFAASALAWALPSVQDVESALQQGRTAQAESMMSEVVAAKPDSARAHYVYAEILARNGKFSLATTETQTARRIDPALKFAQPEQFRAFEQLLEREQRSAARTPAAPAQRPSLGAAAAPAGSSGIPGWVWPVGLAAIGFVAWRGLSRSRAAAAAAAAAPAAASAGPNASQGFGGNGAMNPGAPNAPGMPMNPGTPYGAGMQSPGAGGGLLHTGMAVAGGVAGGMLLDQMLHHRNDGGVGQAGGGLGLNNGEPFQTNEAASELEARPVDFGAGDGWDADAGSVDLGGGSDAGGGWD